MAFSESSPGAPQRRRLDAAASQARREELARRNAAILQRYEAGEPLVSIAADLGMTRERVRQIVKRFGAAMPKAAVCAVPGCPTTPRGRTTYCRTHQIRLDRYGSPLGSKPAPPPREPAHGTYAWYRDHKCRCDLCRKASADRRRAQFHRAHPEWRYRPRRTP